MVYVPDSCSSRPCRVHVSLHGCLMGMNNTYQFPPGLHYGDMYVLYSSYLQYAASNDIIILAPQVVNEPYNLWGCWDFTGYTGKDYFAKDAVQMKAVKAMVDRLILSP